MRRVIAGLLVGLLALLSGCAVQAPGQDSGKPVIRLAYHVFPSGDLVVKHNGHAVKAAAAA